MTQRGISMSHPQVQHLNVSGLLFLGWQLHQVSGPPRTGWEMDYDLSKYIFAGLKFAESNLPSLKSLKERRDFWDGITVTDPRLILVHVSRRAGLDLNKQAVRLPPDNLRNFDWYPVPLVDFLRNNNALNAESAADFLEDQGL